MSESSGAQSPIASPSGDMSQAPNGSPAVPSQKGPERHRVKVEGQERELSIDELKRDYQLAQASNKRFQEASQLAKRFQPMQEALEKGDFKRLLGDRAKSREFREFAEQYLIEQIEYEDLPEHEKRRLAAEQRAEQLAAELKRRDEDGKKQGYQKALADAATEVDTEIAEVLQKTGRQPTPYLVVRIIDELIARNDATDGKERLPASKAVEIAQRRLDQEMSAYLEDMSDEDFIKRTPAKRLEAIRKHLLAQVQMPQSPKRNTNAPAQQQASKRQDGAPKSIDDAFKDLEARFATRRKA